MLFFLTAVTVSLTVICKLTKNWRNIRPTKWTYMGLGMGLMGQASSLTLTPPNGPDFVSKLRSAFSADFATRRTRGCGRERMASSSSRGEMEKMGTDQLKALKEQADLEVNLLQDSLNNIRTANARLESAAGALNDLSLRPQGKKMLVPLTASLYVPGTLDEADKVLVDIGTGYFIEKTMEDGKDYCQRKINLLKSNYEQLFEVLTKKKSVADEAGMVLQAKVRQLQAATTS